MVFDKQVYFCKGNGDARNHRSTRTSVTNLGFLGLWILSDISVSVKSIEK